MKLLQFRVTNFRSVEDSHWIDVDNVTALIGTNESGKTNILLPLWKLNPAKEGAIDKTSDYAVHAALGLSVAESLLIGCTPVVVEGASDQHYLGGIKTVLIVAGKLKPGRELVFPPAGGTKGVKAVASILGGKDEKLPIALFDSDSQGRVTAESLRTGLYTNEPHLILEVGTFAGGLVDSEIEDLLPPELIARELDRWQRTAEVPFSDELKSGVPIVPQIEAWASKHGVVLEKPGWKVELAKRVKKRLISDGPDSASIRAVLDNWTRLFEAFQTTRESRTG